MSPTFQIDLIGAYVVLCGSVISVCSLPAFPLVFCPQRRCVYTANLDGSPLIKFMHTSWDDKRRGGWFDSIQVIVVHISCVRLVCIALGKRKLDVNALWHVFGNRVPADRLPGKPRTKLPLLHYLVVQLLSPPQAQGSTLFYRDILDKTARAFWCHSARFKFLGF